MDDNSIHLIKDQCFELLKNEEFPPPGIGECSCKVVVTVRGHLEQRVCYPCKSFHKRTCINCEKYHNTTTNGFCKPCYDSHSTFSDYEHKRKKCFTCECGDFCQLSFNNFVMMSRSGYGRDPACDETAIWLCGKCMSLQFCEVCKIRCNTYDHGSHHTICDYERIKMQCLPLLNSH